MFSFKMTYHLGGGIVYFPGLTRWSGPLWACLVMAVVWSGLASPSAQAQSSTIRYVSPQGAGNQSGTNWANALPGISLQTAINASQASDQVWVAGGMYKPGGPANSNRAVSFAMKEGVTIYGGFVGTETSPDQRPTSNPMAGTPSSSTLSGDIGRVGDNTDNSHHVIYNPASLSLTSTAILDGFVITGGNGEDESLPGGGMYNEANRVGQVCSPQIRNCAFVANTGGAMYNDGSSGGTSSPRLINCAFVANTAGRNVGGAMYNNGGATGTSNPTLVNCSFVANSAFNGGAMFNDGRRGTNNPILINCSFLANTASNEGGAIFIGGGDGGTSSPRLTNCVLFGNGGTNTLRSINATVSASYSLFDNTVTGYADGGNNRTTTTSPFVSPTSVALNACGPAIDAGSNQAYTDAGGPPTDLLGNPRIYPTGGRIDMGAVEFQGNRLYVSASQTATAGDGLSWATAFADLQSALSASSASTCGTEIWVARGVYKPTAGSDSTKSFTMQPGVAIYGGFVGMETSLDQRPTSDPVAGPPSSSTLSGDIGRVGDNTDNSFHVIYNPASLGLTSTAILDGFVITGGNARRSSSPDNSAGGGMYNNGKGSVCSPQIRYCTFVTNSAIGIGGAMVNDGRDGGNSSPSLINCAFVADSSAYDGGAIYNTGQNGISSPILINCAFVANAAAHSGGAMVNEGTNGTSNPRLINCTFLANRAINSGAAMYNTGFQGTSTPQLTNCVLFGNGGTNTLFSSNSATVTASYSLFDNTVTGYTDGDNNRKTTTSPFTSLTSVALNACGPAIDAGSNQAYTDAGGPPTDLVGNPRIYPTGGRIDMGAVESQEVSQPIAFSQQPPSASAVCEGGRVEIPVRVTGGLPVYQWYKDGRAVSGQTSATLNLTSVQATDAGRYSVEVTAGCNSLTSTAISLTVNVPPLATLSASPSVTLSCAQPSVTLTASPSGQTYQFSAGAAPIGSSNQATVSSPGLYSVTVISGNGCSGVASVSISQDTYVPAVSITATPSLTITQGQSATLTASGANSYVWSTGSAANPIVVNTEGPYSVTGTTANGCTATAALTLTVRALAITLTGLSASPNPIPVGQPTIFTATVGGVTGAYSYTLGNGANTPLSGTKTSASFSQGLTAQGSGIQTYTLTIADEEGIATATTSLTVLAPPITLTGLAASPNPVTTGQSVLFTATVGGVTGSYAYTLANGIDTPLSGMTSSTAFSQSLTASGSGPQIYTLSVAQGEQVATATAALTVLSSGLAITNLRPDRMQVLTGSSVEFTATLIGHVDGDRYSYTLTNGREDVPLIGFDNRVNFQNSLTVQGSGPQTFTLTVMSEKGTASATASIVVTRENVTLVRFAILGVTPVSCDALSGDQRQVRFTPQYVATNGEPISFSVVNELAPTTQPGPYSLRLYTDNPTITLVASQGGRGEVRFIYNWLAACQGTPNPPQPPVSTGIPSQTLLAGQPYQLVLTDYVTDPDGQTPLFTVQGLPAGLNLSEGLISGTPSTTGTYPVSVTATDPGGLFITVSFTLAVVPASGSSSFALVGVSPVSCVLVDSIKQGYRVSFTPQYGGLTGQPISFSVVNELSSTTTAGPYTLRLYADNPVITLKATQAGSPGEASFRYNWLAACGVEPINPGSFGLVGVTTVNCESVGSGQRRVSFTPQYAGRDGSPVSFSVVNELGITTEPGPYRLTLYLDNPTITLTAQQGAMVSTYRYDWLTACPAQPGGRLGTGVDYSSGLHVTVLGNPIGGSELVTEVTGAEGLPLQYELTDSRGRILQRHQVTQAGRVERQHLPIGNQPAGLLLLRVSAPTQSQTVKVLKGE